MKQIARCMVGLSLLATSLGTLALPSPRSPDAGAAQAELTQPLFPWTQKQQNMIREGMYAERIDGVWRRVMDPSLKSKEDVMRKVMEIKRLQPRRQVTPIFRVKSANLSYYDGRYRMPGEAGVSESLFRYPQALASNFDVLQQHTLGEGRVLAILDTRIDPQHPALSGVDLTLSHDFERDRPSVTMTPAELQASPDELPHGTLSIGTAIGTPFRSFDGGGASKATGMYLVVANDFGFSDSVEVVNAVLFALQEPNESGRIPSRMADAISLSYLFGEFFSQGNADPAIKSAADLAFAKGVPIFISAGNERKNGDELNNGPMLPGVFLVAGYTLYDGSISPFSTPGNSMSVAGNFETRSVSVRAANNEFQYEDNVIYAGTSSAAPHVASAYILAKSLYPELTSRIFEQWLTSDAITLPNEVMAGLDANGARLFRTDARDSDFGHGVLDGIRLLRKINEAKGTSFATELPPVDFTVTEVTRDSQGGVRVVFTSPAAPSSNRARYGFRFSTEVRDANGALLSTLAPSLISNCLDSRINSQKRGGFWVNEEVPRDSLAPDCQTTVTYRDTGSGKSIELGLESFTAARTTRLVDIPPAAMLGLTLSADRLRARPGDSLTLTWQSTNATRCVASGAWQGEASLSGSQRVTFPGGTAVYQLTCSNSASRQEQSVTVSEDAVQPSAPPPSSTNNIVFSTRTPVVQSGNPILLEWTSAGDSCQASGAWSGAVSRSGSATVVAPNVSSPTQIVFALTCTSARGTDSQQLSVGVTPATGATIGGPSTIVATAPSKGGSLGTSALALLLIFGIRATRMGLNPVS